MAIPYDSDGEIDLEIEFIPAVLSALEQHDDAVIFDTIQNILIDSGYERTAGRAYEEHLFKLSQHVYDKLRQVFDNNLEEVLTTHCVNDVLPMKGRVVLELEEIETHDST